MGKKPIYCNICGKKIIYRKNGKGGCSTIDKEHNFCCNHPDCEVDGSSHLQLNRLICNSCGVECKNCDIIAECD